MRGFGSLLVWFLAVGLSLAGIGKAAAQQSTTATYGDWVLQCQSVAGPPPQKICDIAQVTEVQGKNIPLSRIAISRAAKTQAFTFSAQVPVNVSFRANLRIQVSASDPGLAMPFDHCLPVGCFVQFELKEDVIRKFTAATAAGKMTFKSANGQDIAIPISFKGFPQAFSALGQE
jgi:invasion protein IalB